MPWLAYPLDVCAHPVCEALSVIVSVEVLFAPWVHHTTTAFPELVLILTVTAVEAVTPFWAAWMNVCAARHDDHSTKRQNRDFMCLRRDRLGFNPLERHIQVAAGQSRVIEVDACFLCRPAKHDRLLRTIQDVDVIGRGCS